MYLRVYVSLWRRKKPSIFTSERGEQIPVKAAREARLVPRAVDMGRAENVDGGEQECRSLRWITHTAPRPAPGGGEGGRRLVQNCTFSWLVPQFPTAWFP